MRTHRPILASRTNGARSSGPVTVEGKARASRNAITQGRTSRDVVLGNENHEAFEAIRLSFHADLRPETAVEAMLVDDIAASYWRILRAESHDTALCHHEMELQSEELDRAYSEMDEPTRQVLAVKSLAGHSRISATLDRQTGRLVRQHDRARDARDMRRLLQLQAARKRDNEILQVQNEPDTPTNEEVPCPVM